MRKMMMMMMMLVTTTTTIFHQKVSIETNRRRRRQLSTSVNTDIRINRLRLQPLIRPPPQPTFNTPTSASASRTTWPRSSRGLSPRMRCARAADTWSATSCATGVSVTATTSATTWPTTCWSLTNWCQINATATSYSTSPSRLANHSGVRKPSSTPQINNNFFLGT